MTSYDEREGSLFRKIGRPVEFPLRILKTVCVSSPVEQDRAMEFVPERVYITVYCPNAVVLMNYLPGCNLQVAEFVRNLSGCRAVVHLQQRNNAVHASHLLISGRCGICPAGR